ncbi:MAG TPA: hypothetical protein VMY36_01300 [Patescibacteria group bacterium]|nr:hypothetical protein [Patescibacteria group bacterium]
MRKQYKTISFPQELYEQIEELVPETGFRTVTEFILYYTRRAVAKIQNRKGKVERAIDDLSPKEAEKIKDKLRKLGYLE